MADSVPRRRCSTSNREFPAATAALTSTRMLTVGDAVEVRSEDDGFLGSWHSATVITCGPCRRKVRYLDILEDDGRDHLVGTVTVSQALDGLPDDNVDFCNYRGFIRPPPPECPQLCTSSASLVPWEFSHGLCVDVRYRDAWWEGVIFDVREAAPDRNVFFPDLGDEMLVNICDIRVTQDWEEGTGRWRVRGDWLFLQVIEEYKEEWPLVVSVKQIWYDVREEEAFKGMEWTSTDKSLWRMLVLNAMKENLKIAACGITPLLQLPPTGFSAGVCATQMESPEAASSRLVCLACSEEGADAQPEAGFLAEGKSKENMKTHASCMDALSCSDSKEMPWRSLIAVKDVCRISVLDRRAPPKNSDNLDTSSSHDNVSKDCWHPAKLPLSAGYHPEAIKMFLWEKSQRSFSSKVREHLLFLGYKIEVRRASSGLIFRYTSPEKNTYYSLRAVCRELMGYHMDVCNPDSEIVCKRRVTGGSNLGGADGKAISRSRLPDLSSRASESQAGDTLMQSNGSIFQNHDYGRTVPEDTLFCLSSSSVPKIEPLYNPRAVLDYHAFPRDQRGKLLTFKFRRHLLAIGWKLVYLPRASVRKMFYISPENVLFDSLSSVCKHIICDKNSTFSTSVACRMISGSGCNRFFPGFYGEGEKFSEVKPREITGWGKGKPRANNRYRKRRWTGVDNFASLFDITKTKGCADALAGASIHDKGSNKSISTSRCIVVWEKARRKLSSVAAVEVGCKTWEFRHSRRVASQIVPSAAHHNPRTVLSWLMDGNILLPRAKVCYSRELSYGFTAEGRVNREGIKCSCCNVLFTLRGFACHADGRHGRTSSCIFLEDRRSLLDCQIQMLRKKRMVGFSSKPYDKIKSKGIRGRSDNICSVCHYGGQLILCDYCPSAFHEGCLGLEEFPDGDWFCPSCCCRICGQSKIREEHGNILTCDQCRQKFHMHCLNYKRSTKVTRYQKKSWYCSKKCAEISLGLSALSGKPVKVGQGNMTWTLLQPIEIDIDNVCAPKNDDTIEINSKLGVAVDVIHECFEPVKEFETRDLIEDVVFNQESPLGRLNFKGFYTVLLERNDELISVACVRVHGEDVAEVPLVATRFHYRRQGMCRILMNELEKKLTELGVGKLILPAVLSVLNTWTQSFKFTRMTRAERLKYLNFTFLDFQDTIMCQKHLMDSSSSERAKGSLPVVYDTLMGSQGNVDLDWSSTVSEVLQADNEESGRVNQDDGVDVSNPLPDSRAPAVSFIRDNSTTCSDLKINPGAQLQEEAISGQSPENFDEKIAYSILVPLKNFYKRRRKQ